MKLTDIINEVSGLYREDLRKITEMRTELMTLQDELRKAADNGWENISVARRGEINSQIQILDRNIEKTVRHSEGVSDVRELLFTFYDSYDAELEE
jgi:hypothetical protein